MMFFCNTQPAHFGNGIPGGSLLDDIPLQCVGNPLIFQIPDVGTEGSAIPTSVFDVLIVDYLIYGQEINHVANSFPAKLCIQ